MYIWGIFNSINYVVVSLTHYVVCIYGDGLEQSLVAMGGGPGVLEGGCVVHVLQVVPHADVNLRTEDTIINYELY